MNPDIARLYKIAGQPERLVLGLMSGTSLDGLDMALCRFTGNRPDYQLLEFTTVPYDQHFKEQVLSVFSKRQVSLEQLCLLHPWVAQQHAGMVNATLKKWGIANEAIDLLASHGQTVFHAPQRLHGNPVFGNATLQIGDGDQLAMATGIITISDFRQKNIAAGGEGAPLATYGDALLFRSAKENRVLLNIGGIANFTWLPAADEKIIATDTGPGNTIMDAFMRSINPNPGFDEEGSMAASGTINQALLQQLKSASYFTQALPKTTGPELFNLSFLEQALEITGLPPLPANDIMATLNRFTAETIADTVSAVTGTQKTFTLYCSGGGVHNKQLMKHLADCLPCIRICSFNVLGVNPDAKEALLFAVLADACVCGYGKEIASVSPAVAMGKISLPH